MVLGIVIAVVAFLLVIFLGRGSGGSDTGARTQDVVVSAVDIPAGEHLSDALVRVVKFAPDQVPSGAQATTKGVVGQYAAVALPKNTVLTTANLVTSLAKVKPVAKPYLDIPKGQVAIAIPAGGELQAVGGYIQQDDRVDILYNPNGSPKLVWKTTYQNLRVARIGPSAAAPASGAAQQQQAGVASSMIVYVTLEDAENLTELFASGNFKLALRSQQDASDTSITPTTGATTDSFMAKFQIPK
jgi:Flp pilus assembly protein CpaB